MSESKPIHVTTKSFESEVIDAGTPVVVDFWAPWCGPCRAIGPVLDELAGKWAGQVKVAKVNIDEEPEVANAFNVRSIPTIIAMSGRDVLDVQVGFGGKGKLEQLFDKAALAAPAVKAAS